MNCGNLDFWNKIYLSFNSDHKGTKKKWFCEATKRAPDHRNSMIVVVNQTTFFLNLNRKPNQL